MPVEFDWELGNYVKIGVVAEQVTDKFGAKVLRIGFELDTTQSYERTLELIQKDLPLIEETAWEKIDGTS